MLFKRALWLDISFFFLFASRHMTEQSSIFFKAFISFKWHKFITFSFPVSLPCVCSSAGVKGAADDVSHQLSLSWKILPGGNSRQSCHTGCLSDSSRFSGIGLKELGLEDVPATNSHLTSIMKFHIVPLCVTEGFLLFFALFFFSHCEEQLIRPAHSGLS